MSDPADPMGLLPYRDVRHRGLTLAHRHAPPEDPTVGLGWADAADANRSGMSASKGLVYGLLLSGFGLWGLGLAWFFEALP